MGVRRGYKQTEAGVIPEDWEIYSIGDSMRLINGRPFKPEDWKDLGLPIIRIQNLNDAESRFNYYSGQVGESHRIQAGDLLFAWSGTTGTSFGARIWGGPTGVLNQHIFKVLPDERKLTPHYAFLVLLRVQQSIEKHAHGFKASFVHVKKSDLVGIHLPVPPTKIEQEAIAESLSDADALIESLEQLIAKKRHLKHGTMQELLTGRKRLPGFSGECEVKRLGEICNIEMGRTPARLNTAFWGRGYKWLSISDLRTKVVTESKEEITELAASELKTVPSGTLLMSFKLSIGRLCFAGCDLFTNEAICSFNKLQANAEFLYYILGRTDFSLYGKQAVKGYTLNKESLRLVEVRLPARDEQTAIAAVLSDMDAEIAALEAKLAKARQLKQGMMHNLLTGRIRLV